MLVSALMATFDRRQLAPRAIRCFLAQDYPEKELVIVDGGDDPIGDLVPHDSRIRYLRSEGQHDLRHMRNATARAARGDVMLLWDDDDWHGPQRMSRQVAAMEGGAGACLLDPILFHELGRDRSWRWSARGKYRMAVGTLAFTRRYYDLVPDGFPEPRRCPSDQQFVRDRPWREVVYADGSNQYIALRHDANTSDCTFVNGGPWTSVQSVSKQLEGRP